jgi:hypothetical protein
VRIAIADADRYGTTVVDLNLPAPMESSFATGEILGPKQG